MAGTMPHAIFVETGLDDADAVAAYAAELPGCAVFAATDEAASASMPRRVNEFTAWLRQGGLEAPTFVGDNWYEVERAAAVRDDAGLRRARFTLDELPPSDEEFDRYLTWLELAREDLATVLDSSAPPDALLEAICGQDERFVAELGGRAPDPDPNPMDRLYGARDALTDALRAAGAAADGVRGILRLAIADDLRLADELRGAGD